jgi:hypothetical protein
VEKGDKEEKMPQPSYTLYLLLQVSWLALIVKEV